LTGTFAIAERKQASLRISQISITRGARPGEDLIRVTVGNGIAGFGEGAWCEQALRRSPEIVLGRSPFEMEAIYDELASEGETPGGLDIALWDLAGKSMSVPSASLLGKVHRSKVLACAAVADCSRPEPFRMWRWQPASMQEVRGGFDCGVRSTAASEREALAAAASLDRALAFWESPLVESDIEGYCHLRRESAIPIAASGALGLDQLIRDLIQPRLVDIVIPEIGRIGLTGARRLAYYCWLFRVRAAVACAGNGVGAAAALAAAACFVPVTNAIAAPAPFVLLPEKSESALCVDGEGMLVLPGGSGLGVGATPAGRPPDILLGEKP
jgi:L-alanine-DL-glutamate epimerase-like enolase superfamily enzyme